MKNTSTNLVYIVALSDDIIEGWDITLSEVYTKYNRYFHPAEGRHRPETTPELIGFRHNGQLSGIYTIKNCNLTKHVADYFPEGIGNRTKEFEKLHCVYELGRKISFLSEPLKTGEKIYNPTPDLCYLDYLYQSKTVSEAIDKTKKRFKQSDFS